MESGTIDSSLGAKEAEPILFKLFLLAALAEIEPGPFSVLFCGPFSEGPTAVFSCPISRSSSCLHPNSTTGGGGRHPHWRRVPARPAAGDPPVVTDRLGGIAAYRVRAGQSLVSRLFPPELVREQTRLIGELVRSIAVLRPIYPSGQGHIAALRACLEKSGKARCYSIGDWVWDSLPVLIASRCGGWPPPAASIPSQVWLLPVGKPPIRSELGWLPCLRLGPRQTAGAAARPG